MHWKPINNNTCSSNWLSMLNEDVDLCNSIQLFEMVRQMS